MRIHEIFKSIEGEGKRAGQIATFVRAYGCTCACTYCDTTYACEGGEYTNWTIDEIVKCVEQLGAPRVTFTGGEPLMQEDSVELIDQLTRLGYEVNIETNGSIDLVCLKNVEHQDKVIVTMDYKSISSGMSEEMIEGNLDYLGPEDAVKFVVGTKDDLDQMRSIVERNPQFKGTFFVSPVFEQIELVDIAKYLLDNNLTQVKMQVQLHKIIWPADMRGV